MRNVNFFFLVPDRATFVKMLEREKELLQSKPAQRSTSLPCYDKRSLTMNAAFCIQLRVVREFGLPDSAVEVLQNCQYYYTNSSCRRHPNRYQGQQRSPQPQQHQHHQQHQQQHQQAPADSFCSFTNRQLSSQTSSLKRNLCRHYQSPSLTRRNKSEVGWMFDIYCCLVFGSEDQDGMELPFV